MRIIIFGTGEILKRFISEIINNEAIDIAAFIDNNSAKWGNEILGIPIYDPKAIHTIEYDKVVIMSNTYMIEMKRQLLEYGVNDSKITFWEELCQHIYTKNVIRSYGNLGRNKKSILIITYYFSYNGSSLAAFYLAMAAKKLGYYVEIACPKGSDKLIEEVLAEGINVSVCKRLPFILEEEKNYIDSFDFVVVNTLCMIVSAIETANIKPMFWWLHESVVGTTVYRDTLFKYNQYIQNCDMNHINILAVSDIAKGNFNKYFPDCVKGKMVVGIPDTYSRTGKRKKEKIIFTIIGKIYNLKGYHILTGAVDKLKHEYDNFEIWVVGATMGGAYSQSIMNEIDANKELYKYKGVLTRKEMEQLYREVDVVICASLEETLSMAILEGMMNEKVCITTDNTGVAEYIESGKNGFVCEAGNVDSMYECMKGILENPAELHQMAKNARDTYEKYFTIQALSERLKTVIEELHDKSI